MLVIRFRRFRWQDPQPFPSVWCPTGVSRRAAATTIALMSMVLTACTAEDRGGSPSPSTDPVVTASESPEATWSLDGVRVDTVPRNVTYARNNLPGHFPSDDAARPDLLADPPGRAVLAYHPREFFEPGGWASERIDFLGADGGWRSLDMADLGLPESAWPGVDSYGAGELSYDGRLWAGRTNFGVVIVDLGSGQARTVETPGVHTSYVAWRPDGQQLDMIRLGDKDRTYRTWSLDLNTGKVRRAPYRLPLASYASDGSVVTFKKRDGGTQRVNHYPDGTSSSEPVAVPYRRVRYGALVGPTHSLVGLYRSVVVVDNVTMSPHARLAAPFSTTIALGWLDTNRVLLALNRVGLTEWNVQTGEFHALTRVRPALQPDSYWSVAVAADLLR